MTKANSEWTEDNHVLLKVTTVSLARPPKRFKEACINFGAQLTIIGESQAKNYCKEYGETIKKFLSDHKYRFGRKRHRAVGSIKIRLPISESHVIIIKADVVDAKVSFLLGLDVLKNLRVLLDVGNGRISLLQLGKKCLLIRKRGHL